MARFVVDPAIAVKWFVPEEFSGAAARLLDRGSDLAAPDTFLTDAARIVATKTRLGQLTAEEGIQVVQAIESVPVLYQPSWQLLDPGLRISSSLDLPFGAGLGLASAVHRDCRLVTASRNLYQKVQGTPFAMHVKWVGDIR